LYSPNDAGDHVRRFTRWLPQTPSWTGPSPLIDVNEYGAGPLNHVPGSDVGFVAAFEATNTDLAGRSCGETCGMLDQLFTGWTDPSPFSSPTAIYWDRVDYANMSIDGTGNNTIRVPVQSSAYDLTGFATKDDSTQQMWVLLGRQVECKAPCPSTTGTVSISADIAYPYSKTTATATVYQIPNPACTRSWPQACSSQQLTLSGQTQVSNTSIAVQSGHVTVPIPAFADGDAYWITLS
jgi:hypothetical protein